MADPTLGHSLPVGQLGSETNRSQGKMNTYCSYHKSIREGRKDGGTGWAE